MTQTLTFGRNVAIAHGKAQPTQAAGRSLWQRLTGLFWQTNERLQTIRELRALNDAMLSDIGVDRGDIERMVDELLAGSPLKAGRLPQ